MPAPRRHGRGVRSSSTHLALAALLALCSPGVALAQVTFDEALGLSARSPAARRAGRVLEARRAGDVDIGGTAQATTVTLMPGALLSPDAQRGLELQLSVTQGWNLADLGGARRRAAGEERLALAARARADALSARLEAARRWIELRTVEELARLVDEEASLAHAWMQATRRGAEVGVLTAADVAEVEVALAHLQQRRLQLEGERVEASARLASAMGASPGEPALTLTTAGPAPAPLLPDEDEIQARLDRIELAPSVEARRLAVAAARARVVEAAAEHAPVLQLGAQLERSAADSWVLFGVAGLSFEAFGQGARATSAASAALEGAEVDAEAERLRVASELVAASHEVEHTRRQREVLRETLLPAMAEVVERRERALALGEGTIFAVVEGRRRLLSARALAARADGARTWAEVRLWHLLAALDGRGDDR